MGEAAENAGEVSATAQRVSGAIIEEVKRGVKEKCDCDGLGLSPGMPVSALHGMGAGCTAPRWICPVLLGVRRRYGQ